MVVKPVFKYCKHQDYRAMEFSGLASCRRMYHVEPVIKWALKSHLNITCYGRYRRMYKHNEWPTTLNTYQHAHLHKQINTSNGYMATKFIPMNPVKFEETSKLLN